MRSQIGLQRWMDRHLFNMPALEVTLMQLLTKRPFSYQKTSEKAEKRVKQEEGDLLRLCHTVPLEVVSLGGFSCDCCHDLS